MRDLGRNVTTSLKFDYEEVGEKIDIFKTEFYSLSESDKDPITQWLRTAKAKGKLDYTDEIVVELVIELHRKMDALTALIKNEEEKLLELTDYGKIIRLGHDFIISDKKIEVDKEYYVRLDLPVFPKRVVPLFCKGCKDNILEITLLHQKDRKDYDRYITSREREMIREIRGGDAV